MSTCDNSTNNLTSVFQFTEEEYQQYLTKLWDLLTWQAKRKIGIDSSSMPSEQADNLLESILYTLSIVCEEDNLSPQKMLEADFHELIRRGWAILDCKRRELYERWNTLCQNAPDIPNVYYVTTLKNIQQFFQSYDLYYQAHEIPCSIDYPILSPISEEIKGISYIEEYVMRVGIENEFIHCFPLENVLRLLNIATEDYLEDYMNLCDFILTNAIGRTLLNNSIDIKDTLDNMNTWDNTAALDNAFSLVLSKPDIQKLSLFFSKRNREEILESLLSALETLCRHLCYPEENIPYFSEALTSLSIRIETANNPECLGNVFHYSAFQSPCKLQ